MRRFDEPIQVQVENSSPTSGSPSSPSAFLWRGRVYSVRSIDGHWHERRSWWREDLTASHGAGDRRVWRVRAQAGRHGSPGVFDLGSDGPGATDPWLLLCAHD